MDNVLQSIPVALLVLLCPLVMGAMGVGAWLVARAGGRRDGLPSLVWGVTARIETLQLAKRRRASSDRAPGARQG